VARTKAPSSKFQVPEKFQISSSKPRPERYGSIQGGAQIRSRLESVPASAARISTIRWVTCLFVCSRDHNESKV
jgi:hypothetical protein